MVQADEEKEASGRPVPKLLAFGAACLAVGVSSGGLICGTGPFVTKIVDEGYLNPEEASTVFDGAFQIMTWGTAIAAHLNSRVGPRLTALVGCALCLVSHGMFLSLSAKPTPYLVILVAYGVLGWGGNCIFMSAFHFAWLFPQNVARADGIICGLYQFAGLWFLLWNIPTLTLKGLFEIWFFLVLCLSVVIAVIFPDKPYSAGDSAKATCFNSAHWSNPFDASMYKALVPHLRDSRYWLYALTFGLSCCYSVYVQGEIVSGLYNNAFSPQFGKDFISWVSPIVVNSVILLSWMVGWSIDRSGFVLVGFLQAFVCTMATVLALFPLSPAAGWGALLFVLAIQSLQYTIQFSFLHRAMHPDAFPLAMLMVLIVQGLCGFIVWPGLTPNPWGDKSQKPLWILLTLSAFMYVWPTMELITYRHRRRASSAPLVGMACSASSSFVANPRAAIQTAERSTEG